MTSKSGWTPFATKQEEVGGIKSLVDVPTSRNLWIIMKEFNVLPTNPDFQALTTDQVEFIMRNMEKDAHIQKLVSKGLDPNTHIRDEDETWWDTPIEEFNPKGNLDISDEEIATQVEALTSEEDKRKLAGIAKGSKEWAEYLEEEGNDIDMLQTENVIQENLRKAREDAKRLEKSGQDNWGKASISEEEEEKASEFKPMTQESIQEAYKLFEGNVEDEDEYESGPDSGWI